MDAGDATGIYVTDLDGGGAQRLTRERAGTNAMVMSWSPNGRSIAFYRQFRRSGICGPLRLAGDFYVMNADGSGIRRLTRHGQTHYWSAVWSPDSRRIAIVSCHRGGDPEIYALAADGSGTRRLTRQTGWDVPFGWSHDGRSLLVTGGGPDSSDIYLMSADGRRRRNLTRSPENEFGGARWSPDQRRIVFLPRGRGFAGHGAIHVMNADGSNQRNLNTASDPNFVPTWSPDGRELAFAGPGGFPVYVMNADGSRKRHLTRGNWPVWSPARR
jgi:TolB protein